MTEARGLVAAVPLFADLTAARLDAIAALATVERYPIGTTIVRAGDPCTTVRIIVEGRASLALVVPGREDFLVTSVSTGQLLGWSALTRQRAWTATARALKPCVVLALPGAELRATCAADHELGYHVMHAAFSTVSGRLQDAWLQLLDIYGDE